MDKRICVYPAGETDFASNGLGCLSPTRCRVHWAMDGEYELEIEHPIDLGAGDWGKYERLCAYGRTVVAPVPEAPSMALRQTGATATVSLYAIATRKSRLRLRSGPGTSYRCLGYYAKGRKVTLLNKTSADWYEVTAPDGKHGWMAARYLTAAGTQTVSSVTTEILRDLPMRPQPFDIYAFDPGLSAVTARARHVFWRLAENLVCELEIKDKTAQQALDAAFAAALNQSHGFHWHCEDTEKRSMEKMTGRTLADVILGDGGVCETYGLHLLADWFDVFLVKELGARRGVQLRYGKNVTGLSGGYDISNVVTRVVPVGQTKDGNPLYRSGDRWIASERESLYPRAVYGYLDVSEAKVGSEVDGKKLTAATARTLMDKRARELLDSGCDLPDCSLTAKMAQLRYDPAYEDYAALERVCPGDTLGLFLPDYGLTLDAALSEYTFDAISQRYEDLTLGSPRQNLSSSGVTSRQLGRGSVTGSKLAYASVGASALAPGAVSTPHLQADSINAQALQAGSVTTEKLTAGSVTTEKLDAAAVTAEKLAAGSVTAEKLRAGSVSADKLEAGSVTTEKLDAAAVTTEKLAAGSVSADKLEAGSVTTEKLHASAVTADKLAAGSVTTDKLAAGAVTAEKIASRTITSELIKAKTITAESGIIDDSAIGTAQIADGSITSAKIVELNADLIQTGTLSAERLLLVGEDGVIYRINAASSGLSLTELQKDQYKNYINGTVIVAKSITAAQIAAQSITGNEILAGSVTAKEINVSDLFADEATVSALNAMDIRGNRYLQLYVTDKVDGIAVGGRNLLRNTNQGTVNWDWSMQTGGKTVEEYLDGGVRAVKMTRDAVEQAGWSVITYAISEDTYAHLEPNTEYTLSFDYKPSVATANGVTFSIRRGDGSNAATNDGGYWKEIPANEWTHVSGTFTTVENIPDFSLYSTEIYIMRLPTTVNSVHIFKNLKLEKGNKATDWSPAPEDVEGDVSALEQRMSAAELKITADAIVSTVTSSASYKTLSSKADGNATDITGLKTRMTTAESKIDQKADSITLSVLETKVDGIAIGGRNLLSGTNQGTYRWGWSMQTGGKTIEEYLDGGVRAVRMTRDATPNAGWSVISYNMGANDYALLEPNTEYTLSFDYKPSVATANGVMFSIRRGDGTNAATNEGGYWKEIPANKWTHVSGTFMTVENIPDFLLNSTEIYITRLPTTVNSVHIFKNLKLEKGNKATDWSPAPEDPAGSLSVSSDYSKVDINTERVRIVSKRMEVAVPSDDGEDDVLRVDADGVHAEVVDADLIVSDSVVHTQGVASYTPANAGELAEILEGLKNKHLTGDVNINCSGITSGSYAISNVSGSGRVIFSSTGAAVFNSLHIENCGETIVSLYKIGLSNAEDALTVDRSYGVIVSTCAINARVGIRIGTSISTPGRVTMDSCTGDCTYVCAANFGSALRCIGASKPTGWLYLLNGSEVYNTTSDPTFEPASAPSIPTTQTVTVSLSPTSTSTSGYGSKLYQGRYSSSQSLRKGVMLFTLPSDLTSADKIDSATLTIKRIGGVGQGGGVSVHVRCFDQTGTLYASKTAYENQTVSIDVTAAVKAMKTNGHGGLMLYNPDTTTVSGKSYTASYARFAGKGESGAPVLKVSYRK